jgi:mannosyltransferase
VTEGIAAAERAGTSGELAWRLAPIAVALGSLALGVVALGRRSLTVDEAASAATAQGSLGTVASRIVHDDPGQAGGLLLLKLARTIGDSELALRLPFAVAVALAAGLLVVLGTMLLDRIGGLVAGLAFAVNAGVVQASREARPYALGLLGVVLATLLLVLALERGGGWRWVPYAVVAAALPLTHPLAASVLAAHGAALLALRERPDLRRAGIALVAGTAIAGVLLAWMAVDRADAPDGAGTLDLARLGHGLLHPIGANPVLVVAAAAGLYVLVGRRSARSDLWRGVLVAALIAAPLVALLLAALVLPVFTSALVLCAPGLALAAGAAVPLLAPVRGLVWAGVALLVVSAAVTTADRLHQPPDQDWRALTAAVKRVRGGNETVVVVPARARAVVAYYAPYLPLISHVRGSGGWVAVVADTPDGAIAAARPVVGTPRYALLRQFAYGDGLRLQHWVRP